MSLPVEIEDKIIRARLFLFTHHPFFAQLAMYLDPRPTKAIPTLGVDPNGKLWMNLDFVAKASVQDMVWILAHEVMHLVTMTNARKPDVADHMRFNIASDVAINYLITDCSEIPLPAKELIEPWHKEYQPKLAKYDDWITEDIYYDMFKEFPNLGGCSGNHGEDGEGQCDGSCGQGDSDDESGGNHGGSAAGSKHWHDDSGSRCGAGKEKMTEEQAARWKSRAATAAARAKAAGRMPGGLDKFVCDLLQPKKDWRKELRFQMTAFMKGRWTWRRIGRRTAATVRTPGRDPEPPIAHCYFDTSGSMSDEDLIQCFSEGAEIARICGGKVNILLGDAEIYYQGVADENAFRRLPVQRGGTDFRVVFEAIEKSDTPKPAMFVGFSDLCGPFPDTKPDYPVVWCVPDIECNNYDPPWGKVIRIKI